MDRELSASAGCKTHYRGPGDRKATLDTAPYQEIEILDDTWIPQRTSSSGIAVKEWLEQRDCVRRLDHAELRPQK